MSTIDYENLNKSLENLKEQHSLYVSKDELNLPEGLDKAVRNSVVKCFEVCYDTLWKHLKKHLQKELPDVPSSPIKIFRIAFEGHLIDEAMQERLQCYNELRVQSSHDYSMEKSKAVLEKACDFIADGTELYQTMSKAK